MARVFAWLLLGVLVSACGGSDPAGGDGGVDEPDADPGIDPTAELFDPDHVVEVEIEMGGSDWETLRNQTRTFMNVLMGDCLAQPFPSPFTWFQGTVTIDGETLETVGVRKKGFIGSLSVERPGLKLKFDEFVAGREWKGLERLTLNNVRQDPSYLRTCLAYQLFADGGRPAPRCNFAHVTVNGEDLGLYVHVESVDKTFLARHFANNDGNLYEGTLSDFRPDWVATFDKKTNESSLDRSDLQAFVDAMTVDDGELYPALEPLLDVDELMTFWALESLMGHWDGYAANTNNFFMYFDPTDGRAHFLPWGADAVLELDFSFGTGPAGPITSVAATGILARRLYQHPTGRADYLARLGELMDSVWDEDRLLDEIDRMESLVGPLATVTSSAGEWQNALDDLRVFVMQRRQQLLDELAGGGPIWTAPLRDPPCFQTIGSTNGSFTTTWGTIGSPNPFATGSGTSLNGDVNGTPFDLSPVGATAGWEQNPPPEAAPRAQVMVVAPFDDGTYALAVFLFDPSKFVPGDSPIDWAASLGILYRYNPTTQSVTTLGLLGGDSFTFSAASTQNGATVSGSFQLDLIQSPW